MLLAALTLAQAATPTPTNRYIALDAGRDHTCTLHITGRIHCWGSGPTNLLEAPEGRYTAISAGEWHNCAIRQEDSGITCWGRDSNAPGGAFTNIAAGWHFACAVRETGELECWGTTNFGRSVLDYGQADPPDGKFTSVSAGYLHACALRTSGEIACWGRASFGRTNAPSGTFTQVSSGTTAFLRRARKRPSRLLGNEQLRPERRTLRRLHSSERRRMALMRPARERQR